MLGIGFFGTAILLGVGAKIYEMKTGTTAKSIFDLIRKSALNSFLVISIMLCGGYRFSEASNLRE